MIKAIGTFGSRPVLILGLSFGNLDRFRDHPRDTYIKVDGRELNLPMDVMIFSGETDARCTEMMQAFIGPETKVNVSGRLKS